jgi:alkylation response protein AidB-like acyl-CoA dehydrogenase
MIEFGFTQADTELRLRLRNWIADHLPKDWRGRESGEFWGNKQLFEINREWDRMLYSGGWKGLTWPTKFGGQGGPFRHEVLFSEEIARAGAPEGVSRQGQNIVGPMLMQHGTEEQRMRYLQRILSTDDIWCQGFSEANAGSDLAAIATKAVDTGGEFIVTGEKIWTSNAHNASMCYLLVRTSKGDRPQDGLTMLLLDMSSEGIGVQPIKQMSGESGFNVVSFDQVRIPHENLVGEVGKGWQVAMDALSFERALPMIRNFLKFEHELNDLDQLGVRTDDLRLRLSAMRSLAYKYAVEYESTGRVLPQHSAAGKLTSGVLHRDIADRAVSSLPLSMLVHNGRRDLLSLSLNAPKDTVAGGTSQIQLNVIAQRALGL